MIFLKFIEIHQQKSECPVKVLHCVLCVMCHVPVWPMGADLIHHIKSTQSNTNQYCLIEASSVHQIALVMHSVSPVLMLVHGKKNHSNLSWHLKITQKTKNRWWCTVCYQYHTVRLMSVLYQEKTPAVKFLQYLWTMTWSRIAKLCRCGVVWRKKYKLRFRWKKNCLRKNDSLQQRDHGRKWSIYTVQYTVLYCRETGRKTLCAEALEISCCLSEIYWTVFILFITRAGHLRYFFIISLMKNDIFAYSIKLIWLGVGF